MARYGEDFSGGRRYRRYLGDVGIGYDQGYFDRHLGAREPRSGRSTRWGERDSPPDRSRERQLGWQSRSRGQWGGGQDRGRWMEGESGGRDWRDDFAPNRGRRYASGGGPMGWNDLDEPAGDRFRSNRYDSNAFGGYRGRESIGDSWRSLRGYDRDFGDRMRRGWDRLRNEAREMFDRGYDRDW